MFSGTWPKEVQNLAELLLSDSLVVSIGTMQLEANQCNHDNLEVADICEEEEEETR